VAKTSSFSLENQALPWNAVDMQAGSAIRCRKCDHAIVKEGVIGTWKDLPSENWAEMMEFWHCHKPHDHGSTDDEHLTKRGYGASNAISAQPGVGFVDITSFMFAESDCNSLSVRICTKTPFYRLPMVMSSLGKKEDDLVGCPKPDRDMAIDTTPREKPIRRSRALRAVEPLRNLPSGNGFAAGKAEGGLPISSRQPETWLLWDSRKHISRSSSLAESKESTASIEI
jgi:hypothetical protein